MYQCSPYCFDRKCDRFNGTCLTGCTDNFYGEKCDKGNQNHIIAFNDSRI